MSPRINATVRLSAVVAIAVVTTVATLAIADSLSTPEGVPRLIPFRGYLEDDGAAMNSEVSASFSIYASPTPSGGEIPLWGPETHIFTPANGAFTVMLGEIEALAPTVLAGGDAYVEVSVEGTVLSGRQRLGSAPFSLRSNTSYQAENVDWTGVASVPAGFSDGTDNEGVSTVVAGRGLSGGGSASSVTLNFAPTVSTYTLGIPRTENFNALASLTMTPSANSFCALSLVRFGDDNDEDDTNQCHVVASGGNWFLQGRTNSNESTGSCHAVCLRW